MPGVISKLASWIREVRLFFLRLLNRLQSVVLRNQTSDDNALKLFWIEDRRIKICEEIFAVDLEVLTYIQRSHPTTFDEKLRKFAAEKQTLIDSWRNPILPENLVSLPTDPDRRRQLCVQRAERCKKLYDSLAGYKTVYNEVIEEVGIVLTYDEKLHFTKPFSLFDPTCTCCFLEVEFHFPPLSPAEAVSSKPRKISAAPIEDDTADENAPLLAAEEQSEENAAEPIENEETTDHSEFLSPQSKLSESSFRSCEPFQSPSSEDDNMGTVRSGSPSNNLVLEDGDSSDGTWNAEDAGDSSSAAEGSIHTGKDSSSSGEEEAYGNKSEDDDYVGGGNGSDEAKENGFDDSKNSGAAVNNSSESSSQMNNLSFRG